MSKKCIKIHKERYQNKQKKFQMKQRLLHLAGFFFTVKQLIYYEKILFLTTTTFLHIIYIVRVMYANRITLCH